jgi:hypothetical protein
LIIYSKWRCDAHLLTLALDSSMKAQDKVEIKSNLKCA